jgi:protein-S-isoprenylcysteine O-methyltransferase Ste14
MKNIINLPAKIVLILIAAMFVLDLSLPVYKLSIPGHTFIALAVFVSGLLIIAVSGYSFKMANTTIDPTAPEEATRLVTGGIYRYSRNPMYIGFLAWLLACALYLENIVNFIFLPLYIVLANKLYILPEESALEKLFKDEFTAYIKAVRRWL